MKTLLVMDLQNYELLIPRFFREAVCAIILKDGKYALVRSEKEGYLKFPDGGIKISETHQ